MVAVLHITVTVTETAGSWACRAWLHNLDDSYKSTLVAVTEPKFIDLPSPWEPDDLGDGLLALEAYVAHLLHGRGVSVLGVSQIEH